jgi:putative solute:sodium symporter small subunit
MTSRDGAKPRSPESLEAARRQRTVGWTMTGVLAAIYLAYLFTVVLAPERLAPSVFGNFSLGLVSGAGVIFAALALSFWYVAQANRNDERDGRTS